jgi:hypothetical protein
MRFSTTFIRICLHKMADDDNGVNALYSIQTFYIHNISLLASLAASLGRNVLNHNARMAATLRLVRLRKPFTQEGHNRYGQTAYCALVQCIIAHHLSYVPFVTLPTAPGSRASSPDYLHCQRAVVAIGKWHPVTVADPLAT